MARGRRGGKRRRRSGRGGGGRGGGRIQPNTEVVDLVVITPPTAARGPSRKSQGGSMARRGRRGGGGGRRRGGGGRRGTIGGMSYTQVSQDIGVQIGCEVGELTAALVKGSMDMLAEASESTVDDNAFPVIQKVVGSGMRALGDFVVSKKHPALAKVMSAFGSSMSGTVYLDYLRSKGLKAQKKIAERLQGGTKP